MKRFITLAAIGLAATLGFAATAEATVAQNYAAAWADVTNECLQYQGCHNITRYSTLHSGRCDASYFFYDTKYVGRKYVTLWECS